METPILKPIQFKDQKSVKQPEHDKTGSILATKQFKHEVSAKKQGSSGNKSLSLLLCALDKTELAWLLEAIVPFDFDYPCMHANTLHVLKQPYGPWQSASE